MRTSLVGLIITTVISAASIAAPIETASYPDDAAAGKAWNALWGTAPARVGQVQSRSAVLLPCNFAGTKFERTTWDRSVQLNLTRAAAIEIDLFCADPTSIGSLSFYLQSGKGWYSGHLRIPAPGQWSTVRLKKDSMAIEGSPAGWNNITTIRISAWRGGDRDTQLALGGIRSVEADAGLILVRNESSLKRSPGDERSVRQFPQQMAGELRALGFECLTLGDQDLPSFELAKTDLIVLPYAPDLSPQAEAKLLQHIEAGGKVLAFYTISEKLAQAIGVKRIGHQSAGDSGRFSQIRAAEGAPEGTPPITRQKSWNISRAAVIENHPANPRVVAWWFDRDGNPTNQPAVILSDRGGFVTHVLLNDDRENQQKLLLALAGKLNPEIWSTATRNAVTALAKREKELLGPEQLAKIDQTPELKATRDRYKSLLEQVQSNKDKPALALERAAQANQLLLDLYASLVPSAPGEQRAFWCHTAFGPKDMGWDKAIKTLADNGFNAILPNMLWGGVAYYKSDVLPVAPEVKEQGDQVELCLAACRKYGVKLHVWKVNWNMGWRYPKEFGQRMKAEGRTQVKFDGTPEDRWLCPSHPENQKLEIDSMVEVAKKYAVDGIHFDYIRYPDDAHCFCAGCRERFEKILGQKVDPWPAAIRKDPALRGKWNQFRRDNITVVVEAVSREARKVRPGIQISAAVFSNWAVDRDGVAQDWKLWCEKGWLDFVCPMDYTEHDSDFGIQVRRQVEWAGKVPVYPGIGLSVWPDTHDIVGICEKVKIARQAGCKGFTIFEYKPDLADTVLPLMHKGATK